MAVPEDDVLVGRAPEVAALRHGMLRARHGHGAMVLVTGEAGIGRSRLLREATLVARDAGMTVLHGRAVVGGGAFRALVEALVRVAPPELAGKPDLVPFGPVLARLLPGWPVADAPSTPLLVDPVVVLGEAVLALLGVLGGGRGTLLVLDDLQLADPETVALLRYLSGRLTEAGVLLLGAGRDGEPGTPALDVLARDGTVTAMPLRRLTPDEVAAMARSRTGRDLPSSALDDLVRTGDGIPLFLEELLARDPGTGPQCRADSAAVPGIFLELTTQRLARLDPRGLDVVRIAAALGEHRDWPLITEISGLDENSVADGARAAAAAHLMVLDVGSSGPPRWRHPLTRDAVLASMLPPELTSLARRCADALIRDPLPGDRLALAAHLTALAGRRDEAARLLLTLARQSVDAGVLSPAEEALRRATTLAGDAAGLGAEVVIELVRVLALAGRPDEAIAAAGDRLSSTSGSHRMTLCLHLARAAVSAERFADADRYLALAPSTSDPRLDALRAHVALGRGAVDEAVRLAEAAAAEAERRGMPETACEALEIVGRYFRRRDPAASDAAFLRGEQLAVRAGLATWRIRAYAEIGCYELFLHGRRERLDKARRLALEGGMPAVVTMIDLQVGQWVLACEGFVAGRAQLQRCAESARRLGLVGPRAKAMLYVAAGRLFGDDLDDLDAALDEVADTAPHDVDLPPWIDGVRALAAWLDDDLPSATALFGDAVASIRGKDGATPTALWGMWVLLCTLADPADEGPRAELVGSDVLVHPNNVAGLRYAEAVAAATGGRHSAAQELVEAGDAAAAAYPYWRHLLRCMLAEHAAQYQYGDPEAWLRGALAGLSDTGETRLRRRCRQLMRRLGLSVPRQRPTGPRVPQRLQELGVTPREAEVFDLIGLRNDEIAARIHVSPRTVEAHVAALLAKTGAVNRRELGSVLRIR